MAAQPKCSSGPHRDRNARLLEALIQSSDQLLRRQARKHAELPDDADDVLQRAYLLFLERYDGRWEPLPWLYTTVKREAWALRRRAHRSRELSLDATSGNDDGGHPRSETIAGSGCSTEERVFNQELLDDRRRALAALKPDLRQALWLFGLGHSYDEVCQLTGWTYTKVNRSIAEGRAELRRRLVDRRD
jgi:RNA polymerase sigma factor (sigma-70 family)